MRFLQKHKKGSLVFCLVFLLILVASVGITLALLTSATESRANVFSLGDVSIDLEEPGWEELTEEEKTVPPGKTLPKDPQIKNTGSSDAFVYLEIRIPKANCRIVDEQEKLSSYAVRELFSYTVNSGWKLLETDTSGTDYNVYIYGYTSVLKPGQTTAPPLFSTVTFANIVEGDLSQGTRATIGVYAHAIQSDYLSVTGSTAEQRMEQAWVLYQAEPK